MYRLRADSIFLIVVILVVLSVAAYAQSGPNSPRTAEQVFKNIQVLKAIPADELIPSMQFMSSSLGVRCDHCHVEGAFEIDDKKPKQKARQMMQMMFALNQNSFSGQRQVTCFSCHRGALRPSRTPRVVSELSPPKNSSSPPSHSADEILNKYLQAIGGSAAIRAINSEVQQGKINLADGVQFPLEIFVKVPGMRSIVTHHPNGNSMEVVNGHSGWTAIPGHPVRRMNSGEQQAAALDADPHFAADLRQFFTDFKVRDDRSIDGRPVSMVRASAGNEPPVRLYFDQQSGLLVRMVRYVDSPLGRNPTQIDYSDYRDVSGVKMPFQWTVAQPQGRYSVVLDRISVNVPIEVTRFTKPGPAHPTP
ncbi:MAG TPA: c-type cytochrome [Terriglobales bacterium]|nr:c-type cytochrome [Terriglobales bacterium]